MYEPGWYHAQGDPAETVRYWDGQAWQGDATTLSTVGGIEYYDAGPTQIDLGDIATQRTLAEQAAEGGAETEASYALSPYSVSKGAPATKMRKRRSNVLNVPVITLLSVVGPLTIFLLGIRGKLLYGLTALVVIAIVSGQTKTINSIGSSMRTTK